MAPTFRHVCEWPGLLRRLTWLLLWVLGGCAAPAAMDSPYGSLSQLPFQSVTPYGEFRLSFDDNSPSFDFGHGPSRFAAFALPQGPRPVLVDIRGVQSFLPSELSFAALSGNLVTYFAPVVLLLDEQFRVVKTQPVGFDKVDCSSVHQPGSLWLRQQFLIEAPADAAYLVVAADNARARASHYTVCRLPVLLRGVGDLELTIVQVASDDRPTVIDGSASWYPDARGVGFKEYWTGGSSSSARLLLGAKRLRFVDPAASGIRATLDVPLERIAGAAKTPAGWSPSLNVAVADDQGAVNWQTFVMHPWSHANVDDFVAALAQRQKIDVAQERLSFSILPWTAAIDVVSAADNRASARVGDAAMKAGAVAAMPCGLCQLGGCTPDILAGCAAAFAVGATVGGAWAVGRELMIGLQSKPSPEADARKQSLQAAVPATTLARNAFDAAALRNCLARAAADMPSPWRDQGWTAHLETGDLAAPQAPGAARVIETSLTRIALMVGSQSGKDEAGQPLADDMAWLRIDGRVRLSASGGAGLSGELSWNGERSPLARWADPMELQGQFEQGCGSLAHEALVAARKLWEKH